MTVYLTPEQEEVCALLAQGMTREGISNQTGHTKYWVKGTVDALAALSGSKNYTRLVIWAFLREQRRDEEIARLRIMAGLS